MPTDKSIPKLLKLNIFPFHLSVINTIQFIATVEVIIRLRECMLGSEGGSTYQTLSKGTRL